MPTFPYSLRTSVVIPARNEEAGVAGVVTDLLARDAWREILVADDGSTDETSARATAAGAHVIERPYCKAGRDCLLEFLHLLPNRFSTPTMTRLAFMKAGDSVRGLGPDGVRFFLILLKVTTIFSPLRIFLPVRLAAFVTGAVYAVWTIAIQSHVTNSSVLLILVSVLILLIGLVSEQISSLGAGGRRP